jgi:uncharacterized protein (DUF58 family)
VESAATDWTYANNARITAFFLGLAILLISIGVLAVLAFGPDAALAGGALLALAVFLLVFSVLVFLPRLAQRGAVSFSVYSRRSMDEAEGAVRAAIEASGRTAHVERVRSKRRSPPRIVRVEGVPARFRIEVSRHAVAPEAGEWTEIIESFPGQEEAEAHALRAKIAERLGLAGRTEE